MKTQVAEVRAVDLGRENRQGHHALVRPGTRTEGK